MTFNAEIVALGDVAKAVRSLEAHGFRVINTRLTWIRGVLYSSLYSLVLTSPCVALATPLEPSKDPIPIPSQVEHSAERIGLIGPEINSNHERGEHNVDFELRRLSSKSDQTERNDEPWSGEAPKFTVIKLNDPVRVMVDVIGVSTERLETPLEPSQGPITQIGAVQLGGDRPISRLIFTLSEDLEHTVNVKGSRLRFTALSKTTQPELAHTDDQERMGLGIEEHPKDPDELRASWRVESIKIESADDSEDLRFVSHKALIHIAPNDHGLGLPTPYVDESEALSPQLILPGLRVPKRLEQRLDARELDGPIRFMSILSNEETTPVEAQLIAELNHEVAHGVRFVDRGEGEYTIEWTLSPAAEASQQLAQSMSDRSTSTNSAPTFKGADRRSPLAPTNQRRKKRYLGKRIKINIKDADIHNVLRFLADCGQVNIVTSDEVEGTVTLMLNQVPWDQALEIILRSKGLDMVREGNIIRVAPREAIAAERKAELEKTQIKEQLKPIMIRLITVNHAEGEDMVGQVKGVLSDRGSVTFDLRTNTLIIKDIEEHIEAAEDLVKRLDTQTPQVLIEARIVEVNKVNEKELGIQWGGSFNGIVGTGNATGLSFPSSVGLKGAADDVQFSSPGVPATPNFMINLPATVGVGSGGAIGLSLGSVDGAFNLNVRLSAAANRGTVKIVSSPKITTLDNKKALISQGVSIPISQVSAQGVQTVFFDATLSLEVTPHVTQDGNIYLQLKANNDTPDFQNVGSRGDPTILKKEASTQVLLQDGETTVIGGIYTSNAGYGMTEWPILSQVPIIGALFRKTSERSQKNELLIFITPRVINRLASKVNTR